VPELDADAIAQGFIAASGLKAAIDSRLRTTSAAPKIYWHGEIELEEMPLVSAEDAAPSGYLLVAPDGRLPPVLEHAESGTILSGRLGRIVSDAYPDATIERFVFHSSLEIFAEVRRGGRRYAIELPSLRSWEIDGPFRGAADPALFYERTAMDELRRRLSDASTSAVPQKKILQNAMPVRYNQNCNRYLLDCAAPPLGAGTTHCSPNAISGCGPVAWAMWFSALKRAKFRGAEAIWKSSTCWEADWPSFGSGQISQCPDVNRTIWKVHRLAGTTSDGMTDTNRMIDGGGAVTELGVPWKFRQVGKPLYELACYLISGGLPFLWGGTGKWQGPTGAKVGHAVVVYGYDKTSDLVRIGLGWGNDPIGDDRFVYWDRYEHTFAIHLTG
jgi:hypothetical protein